MNQPIFGFRAKCVDDRIVFEDKVTKEPLNVTDILNSIYSPGHRKAPYTDKAYMEDWKTFISLCLTAATSYKFYSTGFIDGSIISNRPYTSMGYEEAMKHIGCYSSSPQVHETWLELLTIAYSCIGSREIATASAKPLPRLMWLARSLELSAFEYFAMHCALVCTLDTGFERVFKYLQYDESGDAPTLRVVHTLYSLAFPNKKAEWFLEDSSLGKCLLFNPDSEFGLNHSLTLRSYVFTYILDEFYISRKLSSYMIHFSDNGKEPLHIDRQVEEARNSLKAMHSRKKPYLCFLSGAAGSGKKTTLRYLAKEESIPLLMIDFDKHFSEKECDFNNILDELLFITLVYGATLCFSLKDSTFDTQIQKIYRLAKKNGLGIFILTESIRYHIAPDGCIVNRIDYPPLELEKSVDFWRLFSSDYDCSPDIDWKQIAEKYILTPGQIETVIRNAAEMARPQSSPIREEMIYSAILFEHTEHSEDNLAHSFDEAFHHRNDYMININVPTILQRLEIWKSCIPPKAPIADDVNLEVLANGLDFSVSATRAVALQAAYFAAAENTSISMTHFVRAARLELQKQGKSEPLFLSSYSK